MGADSRTYKFPLGGALLDHSAAGRDEVPLRELAASYAMAIARRVNDAPQARQGTSSGAADFLTVAGEEAGESLKEGEPTERLPRDQGPRAEP